MPTVPPSYLKRHTFAGGDVVVLAKLASWIPGNPNRLYTFDAREITLGDGELFPPSTFDDSEVWSELRAYITDWEPETVVYYLENWEQEAGLNFEACLAIIDLHELVHWAVPVEDNEQDPDHWERWNAVLRDVVEDVMGVDVTEERDVTPDTPRTESPITTEQATLGGVCDG